MITEDDLAKIDDIREALEDVDVDVTGVRLEGESGVVNEATLTVEWNYYGLE